MESLQQNKIATLRVNSVAAESLRQLQQEYQSAHDIKPTLSEILKKACEAYRKHELAAAA